MSRAEQASTSQPTSRHPDHLVHAAVPQQLHAIRLQVIRLDGLIHLNIAHTWGTTLKPFSKKRYFFLTATDGSTTLETNVVRSKDGSVVWDQWIGDFSLKAPSSLTLRLFMGKKPGKGSPLAVLELSFESLGRNSPQNFDLVISNHTSGGSEQRATLHMAIEALVTPTEAINSPLFSDPTQVDDTPADSVPPRTPPNARPKTPDPNDPTAGGESGNDGDVKAMPIEAPVTPPEVISSPLVTSSIQVNEIPADSVSPRPPSKINSLEPHAVTEAQHRIDLADTAVEDMKENPRLIARATELAGQAPDAFGQATDLYTTWKAVVDKMKWVANVTEQITEIHPYAKMAWSILSFIPMTISNQTQRDRSIRDLLQAIHDAFDIAEVASALQTVRPGSKQLEVLGAMLQHVCDCGDFIQSYARAKGFWERLLRNVGREVDQKINRYRDILIGLRDQFLRLMGAASGVAVQEIKGDVKAMSVEFSRISSQFEELLNEVADLAVEAKITQLPYQSGSGYGRNKGCLPRTREAFLEHITEWVNDPESTRTLILFGQAGTGKSSIAHEVARRFDDIGRLSSSFIFVRGERTKQDAYQLFTTLARDLSDRYPSFKTALGNAIKDNTALRHSKDYGTLFESLLRKPLSDLHILRPILVVIDALDESGDASDDRGLHKFLADHAFRLPSNFRILVTSRPENDIVRAFNESSSTRHIYMNNPELSASTDNDILTYCRENLPKDAYRYAEALAKKAEGLFQWAAAACAYIKRPPSGLEESVYMRRLLDPAPGDRRVDPLDQLYLVILGTYFDLDDPDVKRQYQSVMGQFFAAFKPFSILSLASLRQHVKEVTNGGSVYSVVRDLGSLLSNVTPAESSLPVVPLHTSFRDFLLDERRSGGFYVDINDAHRQLALDSLDSMVHCLRFNICKLENSHQANKDVEGLQSRVEEHIPPSLSYACRLWDRHLVLVALDDELLRKLRVLFGSERLLYWIEALSLLGSTDLATKALRNLGLWLTKSPASSDLGAFSSLIDTALKFAQYFGKPVAYSTPHLYLSALPFMPRSSNVFAQCAASFPNTLFVKRGGLLYWPEHIITILSSNSPCNSVAFSPDGQSIASGQANSTVRVWDAATGKAVREPFLGHSDSVLSVTFSPDGRRIVSGSHDKTIRIWDAATGEAVGEPLRGHEDSVTSVTFSPDGRRIVSGSHDSTIRIWDAATGETVGEPFRGHEDSVMSVTFSPDGHCIASGSSDSTIRIWDAATGNAVGEPFRGHEDPVWLVTFSPDGRRIASGSFDKTIRVWDAATGEAVAEPFRGHKESVTSVTFSPDGRRIASGSSDSTIRIWNAVTGEAVGQPFQGHEHPVTSATFSPDGRCIASCSRDKTIRVWDAGTGEALGEPFRGHEDSVMSVTFSPDGRFIASCARDKTIRVWDAVTGEAVGEPLQGHKLWVTSVTFSPDGRRIASGSFDKTIRIWDAATGEAVGEPFLGHGLWVTSVTFSPDGRRIASGSSDLTIRVWDVATGKAVGEPFQGHEYPVTSATFSPDGCRIASCSRDKTIRVWDAATGEAVGEPFRGHEDWVTSVTFSPDGQHIASGSRDKTIRVWDVATGEAVGEPFRGHKFWVASVIFSPDGRRIVSGSDDSTVRVWDALTGKAVGEPFWGHGGSVRSVTFSPNGQSIASGGSEGTVRMWHVNARMIHPRNEEGPVVYSNMDHSQPASHETADTTTVGYTDSSVVDEDGWIRGGGGELLMWIPQPLRACLYRPSNTWIVGKDATQLDLSRFVHGADWATRLVRKQP